MARKRKKPDTLSRPPKAKQAAHPDYGSDEGSDTLEGSLLQLALGGKLAEAARNAIRAQEERGLAVTFKRGDEVIKSYPDGREEVLAKLHRPAYKLPAGLRIIGER